MNFVVSLFFPALVGWSTAGTFALFFCFMVLQLLWVLFVIPETMGVPLEEMRRKLGIKRAGGTA